MAEYIEQHLIVNLNYWFKNNAVIKLGCKDPCWYYNQFLREVKEVMKRIVFSVLILSTILMTGCDANESVNFNCFGCI